MRIKDRPEYKSKPKPVTFPPNASVRDALNVMAERNYGSVLVADKDEKLLGIVTERDFLKRLLYNNMDADKTKLSDIMTSDVRAAHPDDGVVDWLRIMSNERFRHLPVVDENNKILNLMSQGDFVSYTWPQLLKEATEEAKEVARDVVAPNYQIVMIVSAILIYAILVPLLYKLL